MQGGSVRCHRHLENHREAVHEQIKIRATPFGGPSEKRRVACPLKTNGRKLRRSRHAIRGFVDDPPIGPKFYKRRWEAPPGL